MNDASPNDNRPRRVFPKKQVSFEIPFEDLARDKHLNWSGKANVGDTVVVSVGSNPTTGFTWPDMAEISDEEILQQTDHKFTVIGQTKNVGAPGKDIWTFKANKRGTTTILMDYSRPWARGEKSEWTFKATINVE